jgi:ribosomal protein L17
MGPTTALLLLRVLDLGLLAAKQLPAAVKAARETRADLNAMIREGRDPSEAERRIINARMRTLTARLESDEVLGSE